MSKVRLHSWPWIDGARELVLFCFRFLGKWGVFDDRQGFESACASCLSELDDICTPSVRHKQHFAEISCPPSPYCWGRSQCRLRIMLASDAGAPECAAAQRVTSLRARWMPQLGELFPPNDQRPQPKILSNISEHVENGERWVQLFGRLPHAPPLRSREIFPSTTSDCT